VTISPEQQAYYDAIRSVQSLYEADIFLYNAPISEDGFAQLVEAVSATNPTTENKNCILILVTYGGLANSAYQIARLMQTTYEKFFIFTPSVCKSAGTIIALGAHEIIMDVFSELGPLDVQLLDKDEIGNRKSGLLTRSAFEALASESFDLFSHHMMNIKVASGGLVSFRLAADIASKMTSDLMSPVFAQLNPDVIGSDYRDLSVATEYGSRLAKISENARQDSVRRLVSEYPSHDFIIDRDEAKTLFKCIGDPTDELYNLVGFISQLTHKPSSTGIIAAVSDALEDEGCEQDAESDTDEENVPADTASEILDESRGADSQGDTPKGRSGGAAKRKRSPANPNKGNEEPSSENSN